MKLLKARAEHLCYKCNEMWWHSVNTGCSPKSSIECPACTVVYDPNAHGLFWPDTWDYVDNFAYWVKQERKKAGVE